MGGGGNWLTLHYDYFKLHEQRGGHQWRRDKEGNRKLLRKSHTYCCLICDKQFRVFHYKGVKPRKIRCCCPEHAKLYFIDHQFIGKDLDVIRNEEAQSLS
jgi:hypothetical protein